MNENRGKKHLLSYAQHENSIITLQPVNTLNNPFSKAHKQCLIIETYQILQCESLPEQNQLEIAC